jgi:hypothetical protein
LAKNAEIVFDFNTSLFGHADGGTDAKIKLRELASKLPKDSLLFKLANEKSDTKQTLPNRTPY